MGPLLYFSRGHSGWRLAYSLSLPPPPPPRNWSWCRICIRTCKQPPWPFGRVHCAVVSCGVLKITIPYGPYISFQSRIVRMQACFKVSPFPQNWSYCRTCIRRQPPWPSGRMHCALVSCCGMNMTVQLAPLLYFSWGYSECRLACSVSLFL